MKKRSTFKLRNGGFRRSANDGPRAHNLTGLQHIQAHGTQEERTHAKRS